MATWKRCRRRGPVWAQVAGFGAMTLLWPIAAGILSAALVPALAAYPLWLLWRAWIKRERFLPQPPTPRVTDRRWEERVSRYVSQFGE